MATNAKTAVLSRNAGLDSAFDLLSAGKCRVRDGAQATDADTALGAQVLLADLALNATAFAAASAGSKTANAISDDTSADATGTASWGSLENSSNVRKLDFSVGTSGCNLNLNAVAISAGAKVSVTSFVISQAA